MTKIWLIAANTYYPRLRSGSFLFLTLFFPVLTVGAGIASGSIFEGSSRPEAIGFVDQTGRLSVEGNSVLKELEFDLVFLNDIDEAQSALSTSQIEAYLVVPEGYFSGESVIYYGESAPTPAMLQPLEQFLRQAVWPELPEPILTRAEEPSHITFRSLRRGIAISSDLGLFLYFATPAILAILFVLAVAFNAGQMGSAVVREKEQRAMEMVITSLRPGQLVAGKVLGMSLLALTQFGIWIAAALIALLIYASGEVELQGLYLPWRAILWGVLLIIPGYLLYAVSGAGAGLIAGDNQQAQQLSGFLGLFVFIPVWFTSSWINQPDSALAVGLTLFPFTGPVTALLRMAFTEVPLWQLGASFAILLLTLYLFTWVVGRIFRTTMLVYGQRISPRQLWRSFRQV